MTAPNPEGYMVQVRHDIPGTEIKAGCFVYAQPEPGLKDKTVYVACIPSGKGDGKWVPAAVGVIDPLTKRGTPRKKVSIGGITWNLGPSPYSRFHRMAHWGRQV